MCAEVPYRDCAVGGEGTVWGKVEHAAASPSLLNGTKNYGRHQLDGTSGLVILSYDLLFKAENKT